MLWTFAWQEFIVTLGLFRQFCIMRWIQLTLTHNTDKKKNAVFSCEPWLGMSELFKILKRICSLWATSIYDRFYYLQWMHLYWMNVLTLLWQGLLNLDSLSRITSILFVFVFHFASAPWVPLMMHTSPRIVLHSPLLWQILVCHRDLKSREWKILPAISEKYILAIPSATLPKRIFWFDGIICKIAPIFCLNSLF